jgi:hypothetical protein
MSYAPRVAVVPAVRPRAAAMSFAAPAAPRRTTSRRACPT